MTVWFWDPSFHTEDNWGTHYNYYRRFKHSLMLQKKKHEFEDQGTFNLICLLENMSSVDLKGITKWKKMTFRQKYTHLHSVQKFSRPALNACVFPSGASVSVWIFCNSCIWVPQLSSVWKDGFQRRRWRIFLKNSRQFNCSGQTRDSWTTITKQKNTAVDHSGNNIVLKVKHM